MKDLFNQALEAGETYAHASGTAREAKYRFLGLTYLAYREGLQHPQEFQELLTSRLNYAPTAPEIKRPFLRLLHALMTKESVAARKNHSDRTTKLASVLEQIQDNFEQSATVDVDAVVTFIKGEGGVGRLYDRSRNGQPGWVSPAFDSSLESQTAKPKASRHRSPKGHVTHTTKRTKKAPPPIPMPESIPGQGASDAQDVRIQIANVEAWVIKDGEDTRLKMPAFAPGEHFVRIKVGQDGVVEDISMEVGQEEFVEDWEERIVSEEEDAVQLQPPVCPTGSSEASTRH